MEVRIPPLSPRELGPLARLVSWAAAKSGGSPTREHPRVFTTLGRDRRLMRTWLPFAGSLLFRSRLRRADVELVVLRTACNCSSPYEWVQHVPLAQRAGVPRAAIAAIAAWREHDDAFGSHQLALLRATDELHEARVVSAETWRRLSSEATELQLIELCMLVGQYEMTAMTLNSLGVEPEPDVLLALDDEAAEVARRLARDLEDLANGSAS